MLATWTKNVEGFTPPTADQMKDPGFAAFWLLRTGFTVAPILFGIDKFLNWMVDWPAYLWTGLADVLPGSAQQIMYAVGAIEILAGIVVFLAPRIGATVVAVWLAGIIANLIAVGISTGRYWDIALRDFGLMLGAVALALLASKYRGSGSRVGSPVSEATAETRR